MLFLVGAANRDDRRFPDGDLFDIHRQIGTHLTFGYGPHFCLGRGTGPPRGPGGTGEILSASPMGRRLGSGQVADLHGSGLGCHAHAHSLKNNTTTTRGLRHYGGTGRRQGRLHHGRGTRTRASHAVRLAQEGADIIAMDICRADLTGETAIPATPPRTSPKPRTMVKARTDG